MLVKFENNRFTIFYLVFNKKGLRTIYSIWFYFLQQLCSECKAKDSVLTLSKKLFLYFTFEITDYEISDYFVLIHLMHVKLMFTVDIDECLSSPCANNGTCDDEVGNFICDCQQGFTGETCEVGRLLLFFIHYTFWINDIDMEGIRLKLCRWYKVLHIFLTVMIQQIIPTLMYNTLVTRHRRLRRLQPHIARKEKDNKIPSDLSSVWQI